MPYDLNAARAAGIPEPEIAQYLARKYNYPYDQATSAGVPDSEIVSYLAAKDSGTAGPPGGPAATGAAPSPVYSPQEQPGQVAPNVITESAQAVGKAGLRAAGTGVSKVLQAADWLNDRASRAAGGALRGFTEGNLVEPLAGYLHGAVTAGEPTFAQQAQDLGWKKSPVDPGLEAALNANASPVPFGTTAKMLTTPEAGDVIASTLASGPADIGGELLLKGGAAATRIPKVAEALDVARKLTAPAGERLSRGYTMGYKERGPVREMVRQARGKSLLLEDEFTSLVNDAQEAISKAAVERGLPQDVIEKQVRHLLEVAKRDPGVLANATQSERDAALALAHLREIMPFAREQVGLRAMRLGEHIPENLRKAHVEHVPRILSEEARKAYGVPFGRNVEVSELGTRVPGIRKADRTMTTEDLEALMKQGIGARGPVKEPLVPLLQSFDIRSRQTARSVANADLIKDISSSFSKPVGSAGRGWRKMSDLHVLGGFDPTIEAHLQGRFVDPEVFNYLDTFTRTIGDPEQTGILKGFLKVWKPIVTTMNPQFVSRNSQWNAIIGWIRGNRDPRNWMDAANIMSKAEEMTPLRGLNSTMGEMRKELLRNEIIGTGSRLELTGEMQRTIGGGAKQIAKAIARAPSEIGGKINQISEDLARSAFYLAMRRKGMSEAEAAKNVALTYFNYGRDAATPFLNKLRDTVVPFAVWTRNIIPLTFRSMVENPSAFVGFSKVGEATARAQGLKPTDRRYLTPEARDTEIALTGKQKGKGGEDTYNGVSLSQVGFYDVSKAVRDPKQYVMTQLSPLLTGPAEAAGLIKNALTGKSSNDIVELPGVAGRFAQINPDFAKKLGIQYAADGRAVGPQWLSTLLRMGGPLGTTAFDMFATDKNARDRFSRWLTGVSVRRDMNPSRGRRMEQIHSHEERKQERKQKGQAGQIISEIRAGTR